MNELLNRKIESLSQKLSDLRGFLDLPKQSARIREIEDAMAGAGFWDRQEEANRLIKELKGLKNIMDPMKDAEKRLHDAKELLQLSEGDEDMERQIEHEAEVLAGVIAALEIQVLLSGPYDNNNAILSLNSGAGGTESCDWTSMLFRMYTRWAESKGYKVTVFDVLAGEEAGIKNVSLRIEGDKVYGYLKAEKGVHRLVRISPFDANKRRHTSFASVDVIPEIDDDIQVDINPDDLKVDVFRSSGPGGQSVNTADSAVRITHMPTGIVVQSQVERSQLQNKVQCMKVLKAKLFELKQEALDNELAAEAGKKQKIEWGSQIRSYVLQPYQMIKDHRTEAETGSVQKVLDGDIDMFIEAFLKMRPGEKA
ncbi:MAG: peptide chain release factor 2 [Candidatus Omnitrophica bacterium]|nr:peptide chain release factor 2 [Candidatus Omnitrophota bacterium]